MADFRSLEKRLFKTLGFERRPVAVAFRDSPPARVSAFTGTEPSGCSFWRIAAEGRTFYTVPADHYNCPIGAYTHGFPLPPDPSRELEKMRSLMEDMGYLRMEELSGIPRLPKPPAVVVYAPLADTPVDPDVVLFAGRPGRVMLLHEAALRAGVGAQIPAFGRPTCMGLPAALAGGVVVSTACVGNRVYTDLGEDELYVMVPGKDLIRIADEVQTITTANTQLAAYHRARRQVLATE